MAIGNILAELLVKVKADTSELNSGLAAANQQAQSFGSTIGGFLGKVAVFTAITAAVIGVANAFKESMIATIEYGHIVDKLATTLRMSTDAIQGLMAASKLADVDIETVANAFRILNTRLAEASIVGSGAEKTLTELGLSFRDLQSMLPAERFRAVVDAIAAMEDPIMRDYYALQLLGRGGAGAVEQFKEIANNMGIMASVGGVSSAIVIQQMSATDEKLKTLGIAWDAMWRDAGDYLVTASGLNTILDILTWLITQINLADKAISDFMHSADQLKMSPGIPWSPEPSRYSPSYPKMPWNPGGVGPFGYASGGLAMTPQMASLAENEPEAIIPLSQMSQMGGNNITIQAGAFMGNEGDARRFARIIQDYLREDNRIRTTIRGT